MPLILWPQHGTPSLPEVPSDGIEEKPPMTWMDILHEQECTQACPGSGSTVFIFVALGYPKLSWYGLGQLFLVFTTLVPIPTTYENDISYQVTGNSRDPSAMG